jgi:hypothetical protein
MQGSMNILSRIGIAIAAISLSSAGPAQATVLYDNLVYASEGSDPANATGFGPLFNSFSTGSVAFSLSQIDLALSASPLDNGSFTISVLDGQNFPNAVVLSVGNLSDNQLSSAVSTFTVNFAPLTLAANSRYWIELSATGSVQWSYDGDASGTGVAGEIFQNQNGVFDSSDGPYQMQISDGQVSAVPELPSWTMIVLGFVGLVFVTRYKARRRVGVDIQLDRVALRLA